MDTKLLCVYVFVCELYMRLLSWTFNSCSPTFRLFFLQSCVWTGSFLFRLQFAFDVFFPVWITQVCPVPCCCSLRESFWSLTVENRACCGFIHGLYYGKVDSACHHFVQCMVIGWCWNLPNTFLYWLKQLYLLFSSCSVFWNEIHMQMEIYQRNMSFLFLKAF